MCREDQLLTGRKPGPTSQVLDPAERKRRLSKVYTLLLDLANQAGATQVHVAPDPSAPAVEGGHPDAG